MLVQGLFEGVINGAMLALIAMGIALVWGVMNILSFSQGEFLMLGMYASFFVTRLLKVDPLIALPFVFLILFGLGHLIYKLIIAKALQGPTLSQRLITFALSMVLINSALLSFGGDFRTVQNISISGSINWGWIIMPKQKLIPFLIAIFVAVLMFYFLGKTRQGKAIRATSMDKFAASLVGIDTDRAYSNAFALASGIAGAAGCALSYYYYVYPQVGANFQLFGFIAVAMGGFGSITGAFIAGLIMGIVDVMTGLFLNPALKYLAVCVAFIVIVSIKPKGIFGK